MRIRIYYPFFPYPFSEAAFQTAFNQALDLTALGHTVEMVVWKESRDSLAKKTMRARADKIEVPFEVRRLVDARPENPASRVVRVVQTLCGDVASPEYYYYPPDQADKRAVLPPVDLAIYHYSFSYGWLGPQGGRLSNEKKVVIHFHNLESEIFYGRAREAKGLKRFLLSRIAGKLSRHEGVLKSVADEIWQHGPNDLELFDRRFGKTQQRVMGPTISKTQFEVRRVNFLKRADSGDKVFRLGFVGGLDFEPNRSSSAWILRELAPRLKVLGFKGEIVFAGKPAPAGWLDQFTSFDFVKFLGFVPSLEDYWASLSYLLVPHITGGGVRLKLLEAIGSQLPVLANTAAADRLHSALKASPLLTISDDADRWALKVMNEQAFETRLRLKDEPFNEGLDGRRIYATI